MLNYEIIYLIGIHILNELLRKKYNNKYEYQKKYSSNHILLIKYSGGNKVETLLFEFSIQRAGY